MITGELKKNRWFMGCVCGRWSCKPTGSYRADNILKRNTRFTESGFIN